MKVLSFALGLVLMGALLAAEEKGGAPKMSPGFEKLKTLVGTWQAKSKEGITEVSYKIISAGSGVMETMSHSKDEAAMVTIYHRDGDNLMLTHYCSAGNQPRMRAEPITGDPKMLTFSFLDVTNLGSPDEGHMRDGHMHKLVVTFQDKDHFTEEWTWREKGKDTGTHVFQFERKK